MLLEPLEIERVQNLFIDWITLNQIIQQNLAKIILENWWQYGVIIPNFAYWMLTLYHYFTFRPILAHCDPFKKLAETKQMKLRWD